MSHVHTLHTGILHHSPSLPDTCKGQPVTQPKEVNNTAGIANYIHNLQYWFSPLVMQYQLWHQCKTETLLWDSLIPRLCLPWYYKQSKLQVGKAWERIASSPNRKCVSETRLGYRVGQGFHFRLFQKQCGGGLYRSRYTYFSNSVARARLLCMGSSNTSTADFVPMIYRSQQEARLNPCELQTCMTCML